MFNPIRQLQDFNTGHAGSCPPATNCLTPITNQRVFNQDLLLLTAGDTFLPHACAGVAAHTPIVFPPSCSLVVFISGTPVALAGFERPLNCGDVVIPNPSSKIFIGV